LYQFYASRQTSHVSSSTRWKVFLGTTSCCGTVWPVSLGFSGLFDDFAFFGVLAVDIEALLEGFRRRFCGLMTIDDQVAMDFQKVFFQKRVMSDG
jgi:hypothetical protein